MFCKYQQIQSADDFSISTEIPEDSVAIIINQCFPEDNLVTRTNLFDFRQSFVLIERVLSCRIKPINQCVPGIETNRTFKLLRNLTKFFHVASIGDQSFSPST